MILNKGESLYNEFVKYLEDKLQNNLYEQKDIKRWIDKYEMLIKKAINDLQVNQTCLKASNIDLRNLIKEETSLLKDIKALKENEDDQKIINHWKSIRKISKEIIYDF